MTRYRAALAGACLLGGCSRDPAPTPSAGSASAERPPPATPNLELPPIPDVRLDFKPIPPTAQIGWPRGCKTLGAPRRTSVPKDSTFIAGRHTSDRLVFAAVAGGAHRSGLLSLGAGAPLPFPWSDAEAPPVFESAPSGFIAFAAVGEALLLWRSTAPVEQLASGYQLTAVDAACDGDRCAVLTTRPGKTRAAGASLYLGGFADRAAAWRRLDLGNEADSTWEPSSIVGFDGLGDTLWVALTGGERVRLVQIRGGTVGDSILLDVPHGILDIAMADTPVVLTSTGPLTDGCSDAEFTLQLLGADGTFEFKVPAAPQGLMTRSLNDGAVFAWVAPVSCSMSHRHVVSAIVLDRSGRPLSSPTAIADATGFAVSTAGNAVDLWLIDGERLSWIRAECGPGTLHAPSPSALPSPSAGSSAMP